MRRLAVVAVLVVLSGCNGGDDFPSLEASTTTTVAPAPAGPATSVRSGTGNAFCDFLDTYNERFGRFNAGLTDPNQLRTVMSEAAAAIREAEATAPAEVKADLTTMRMAFESLIRALEQVGFDFSRLRLDTLAVLQNPEFVQASLRMEAYTRQNCL